MNYTTTTNLARNGKKEFDKGIKVVLYNNEDIGMILWKDVYDAIKDSGLIEQIREEMRESKDPTTSKLVKQYTKGERKNAISLVWFKKKYGI